MEKHLRQEVFLLCECIEQFSAHRYCSMRLYHVHAPGIIYTQVLKLIKSHWVGVWQHVIWCPGNDYGRCVMSQIMLRRKKHFWVEGDLYGGFMTIFFFYGFMVSKCVMSKKMHSTSLLDPMDMMCLGEKHWMLEKYLLLNLTPQIFYDNYWCL